MPRTLLCTKCYEEFSASDVPPNSPSTDMLHSSRTPSESDIPQMKQQLAEYLADLAKYDAQLEELMGIIAELQQKRADLKKYVDGHHSLLSSMRKFPSEILGEIFSFCCSEYGLSVKREKSLELFQVNAPALVLSQICSRWRDVMISLPSLWSRMTVNFTYAAECHAKPLIELYLFRSKSALLSLHLESLNESTDTDPFLLPKEKYSISVFGLFLDAVERWKHIDLDLSHDFMGFSPDSYSQVILPHCPNLESLNLRWNSNRDDLELTQKDRLWLGSLVEKAPSLRNLTSSNLGIYLHDDIRMIFKNNQITSLQLYDYGSPFVIEHVFKLFPHLQHLDLTFDLQFGLGPNLLSELCSTILKSLTVRIASWYSISPVLSSLRLPSLVSLELLIQRGLDGDEEDKGSLMTSLETMVRQSSSHLQSFKIDSDYHLTSIQLSDILSWMPSLTDLSIHVISTVLHEGFLAQLTYIPHSKSLPTYTPEKFTSSVLLPRLKSLEIIINFETNVEEFIPDTDSIIAMVESRIARPSSDDNSHDDSLVDKLYHLTVLIPYFRDNSERAWAEKFRAVLKKRLQKHIDQGFTCTITLAEASNSGYELK